jgi:hypothetical protein
VGALATGATFADQPGLVGGYVLIAYLCGKCAAPFFSDRTRAATRTRSLSNPYAQLRPCPMWVRVEFEQYAVFVAFTKGG